MNFLFCIENIIRSCLLKIEIEKIYFTKNLTKLNDGKKYLDVKTITLLVVCKVQVIDHFKFILLCKNYEENTAKNEYN